jgi:hypothetical protein
MAAAPTETQTGIKLFTVRGIQIRVDYSWFIVFALVLWSLSAGYFPQAYPNQPTRVYWMAGLLAAVLFFLSVIAHELSHSFMAIRSGIRIPEITLFIFGGMARLSEDARDPKTELKIAVVGPLMSFALAGVFWLIRNGLSGGQPSIFVEIFRYLSWINVALRLQSAPGISSRRRTSVARLYVVEDRLDDGSDPRSVQLGQRLCDRADDLWRVADLLRRSDRGAVAHLHRHVSSRHGGENVSGANPQEFDGRHSR